jgi:hypothetical protein
MAKEEYFEKYLSDELSACDNSNECSDLSATIEAIGEFFEENVQEELDKIGEKFVEFEGREEARAESLRDDWREARSFARDEGSEIEDMFGTLSGKA